MKLVEILARELESWPEQATMAVQDDDGQIKMAAGDNPKNSNGMHGTWVRDIEVFDEIQWKQTILATDHATAIITREMWEAERAKLKEGKTVKANKEGWIRHRGGKCPVEKGTLVDVRYRNGDYTYGQPALMAGDPEHGWAHDWAHNDHPGDIMSWRLHKPEHPEISDDETIDLCVACADEEVPAAQDGPLQWRDRITEIDAAVEALEEERASLIQRLEDEGFALIKRKVGAVEDMSDWRNWRVGDNVEILETVGRTSITGQLLVVSRIEGKDPRQPVRLVPKNNPDDGWWPHPNDMKWHSRPAS